MDTAATGARQAAHSEHEHCPCATSCQPAAHLGGPGCRLGKNTTTARRATTRPGTPVVAVPLEVWASQRT